VPACELGLSAQVLWILSVIHDPGNVPTFPSLAFVPHDRKTSFWLEDKCPESKAVCPP